MKLQSFIERKCYQLAKKKKLLKRRAFFFKIKIFLTCILPVVIVLLAVKIIQTLVRTEIRKAAAGAGELTHSNQKKPAVQISEKPEFITPKPC